MSGLSKIIFGDSHLSTCIIYDAPSNRWNRHAFADDRQRVAGVIGRQNER